MMNGFLRFKKNMIMTSSAGQIKTSTIDIESIRRDFPVLNQEVYGQPLVYLDNAATTQKPRQVLEVLSRYYSMENSNVHRGVHYLSQKATDQVEESRRVVQHFLNAAHEYEIIFTKGTTESINLVADSFSRAFLKPGDSVIISAIEHHSNIVPWQIACERTGAQLKVIPMDENGDLDMTAYEELLDEKTKLVSVAYASNALGTVNPVREIIRSAHRAGVPVMLDCAQAVQHFAVDVQELDVDFLAFSGHKIYGPTGIGILYGKEKYLDKMPPYQGGGEMIDTVTFEKTTFNRLPFKFEAGTPHIAGMIGLGAALNFITDLGLENIRRYEQELLKYAEETLKSIDGLTFVGTPKKRSGVISFNLEGIHPYDTGEILDKLGIAVRTGHHCTEPVMDFLGIPGTVRASFALYNTHREIERLREGILRAQKMLS